MSSFTNLFTKKEELQLKESDSGVWMVKKDVSVIYIGSKEKCESYLQNLSVA